MGDLSFGADVATLILAAVALFGIGVVAGVKYTMAWCQAHWTPLQLEGGGFMHVRKADAPTERITIIPPERVTDSEGNTVPVGALQFGPVVTDNASAVAVENDSVDNQDLPAEERGFDLVYGAPNSDGSPSQATVSCPVRVRDTGVQIGTFAEVIEITAGDPAQFVGGGFKFSNDPPIIPA